MFINFMLRKPTGIQIQLQKLILTLCKTGRRGLKSTRGIYIIRESRERIGRPSGVNRTTIKSGYTYIVGTNAGQGRLSILKQTSYLMCKFVKGTGNCNRMVLLTRRRSSLWERFPSVLLPFQSRRTYKNKIEMIRECPTTGSCKKKKRYQQENVENG